MLVEVRLFATFREGRFKSRQVELAQGTCPADILAQLEIPQNQVGILLVNGRDKPLEYCLTQDDVVSIFPALGGG